MTISETIDEGENTKVEFKESMTDAAYKTIASFANTEGGTLLCGISDDGDSIGADCSDETMRDIIDKIINTMGIHPSVNSVENKGVKILKIEVEKSSRPISYRGKYYKRVGNTTREMQGEELIFFFQQWSNWDTITEDYNINEIDDETVKKFVKMAINNGRVGPAINKENISEILERFKLIKDGKLTNAAVMLFGKDPQKYFFNAIIQVVRCKDGNILRDTLIEGNLFQQAEKAEQIIRENIHGGYYIPNTGLAREDIWDYPLIAVRESLMNALVHRDYFKSNVKTQIKIFDDHIHFFNIGGLPEGLTVEQIRDVKNSVPRNPLIVRIFYLSGFVEELGSGIKRMINSLDSSGLPQPEFKEESGGFSVYLWKKLSEENLKEKGLNDRQIKAMLYVYEKGVITLSDYSNIAPEVKDRTLRRDLKELVTKKFLKPVGEKKGRKYVPCR